MDFCVINKLSTIREAAGLSQSELALKSGVSLRTIQAYEQGTRSILLANYLTLYKLALACGCSVSDIIYIF